MIRVTLTIELSLWWGADEAWAMGGGDLVRALCMEDADDLVDQAKWKIEKVETEGITP